jgi:hypothetical protein
MGWALEKISLAWRRTGVAMSQLDAKPSPGSSPPVSTIRPFRPVVRLTLNQCRGWLGGEHPHVVLVGMKAEARTGPVVTRPSSTGPELGLSPGAL